MANPPDRYPFLVHLPLDVEPGDYVVRIETQAEGQNRRAASRDIPIRVH